MVRRNGNVDVVIHDIETGDNERSLPTTTTTRRSWSPRSVTYNNVWNMSAENKIYNFSRTVDTSPNLLVSSDNGQTWPYGGRLTSTLQVSNPDHRMSYSRFDGSSWTVTYLGKAGEKLYESEQDYIGLGAELR